MIDIDPTAYDTGDHASFMHKEILEQPGGRRAGAARPPRRAVRHRPPRRPQHGRPRDPGDPPGEDPRLRLGVLRRPDGRPLLEELARIPADAEAASEFRYRNPVIEPDTLYVAVSQSGETIDTLLAVQEIRRKGGRVIGLVNVVGSAIARESTAASTCTPGPRSRSPAPRR